MQRMSLHGSGSGGSLGIPSRERGEDAGGTDFTGF